MIQQFKEHLKEQSVSPNTVAAYVYAVDEFYRSHRELTKTNLIVHKNHLTETFSPRTVNLRLQALNRYLRFCGKEEWHLKSVKVQQRPYLENVISEADYEYLKACLLRDGNSDWYFVVRFLAATGARVSELLQMKAEHVNLGHIDLYGKGGKVRRIYIPHSLQMEASDWLTGRGQTMGYLFRNREGGRITARGIAQQLKNIAVRYGIDTKVIYPHSFRHRFAKNFLDRCNDIALLADLMGHESIETTRIYLRRTATEQREVVDSVVDW